MAKQSQLTRPPLREALVDLQIVEELPLQWAEGLAGRRLPGFEAPKPIRQGRFSLQMEADRPAKASAADELLGWRFDSADGARVAQLRRNGATHNVLRGYTSWGEIRAGAQEVWRRYCEWTNRIVVSRLAVRYINVIEIPLGADFDEYLEAGPRVPQPLPPKVSHFVCRLEIPFSPETKVIVTQALEPPRQNWLPVILDIDVQYECKLRGDSPDVWSRLDELRPIKNAVFFSSLTERALEPYR